MRRLALAAAVLTAAGAAAAATWWPRGGDRPTTLAGGGLSVRLPPGWEGRVLAGPVLRARADGALVVLRDVTSVWAPLGAPRGFGAAVAPGRFRAGGRYFELAVRTRPGERLLEAAAVLESLRIRPRPPSPVEAATRPMPPFGRRACRVSRLLRAACPARVPSGRYPRSGVLVAPVGRPGTRYDVFELEGRRRLVLLAGRYGLGRGPLAGWEAGAEPVGLAGGLLERPRARPVLLGPVRWSGRHGDVVLEDADGGPLDDHLVFRWRRGGIDRAVALRAWEPLREAVAALRAVVASIP